MLEDNVEAETKISRHIEAEMKKTDDEALKLLLKHIADQGIILKKAFQMGP